MLRTYILIIFFAGVIIKGNAAESSDLEIYVLKLPKGDTTSFVGITKSNFHIDTTYQFFEALDGATYWIKVPVANERAEPRDFYFIIKNAYLRSGDFWLQKKDTFLQGHHHSYRQNLNTPRLSNYPTWEFTLNPGEEAFVYFRIIDNETRTRKEIEIVDEKKFAAFQFSQFGGFAGYSAVIIIISFLVIILAIANKQYYLFFYVGYILFFIVDYGSLKGFFQTYVWPSNQYLLNNGRSLSHLLITLSGTLFFASFYKRRHAPAWVVGYFRVFAILLIPFLVIYIIKMIHDQFGSLYIYLWSFININLIIVFVLHLVLSFKKLVPGYLVIAFLLPIVGTLGRNNFITDIATTTFFVWLHNNSYFISILIELVLISYYVLSQELISYRKRIKVLERETDKYEELLKAEAAKKVTASKITLKSKAVLSMNQITYIRADGHYLEFYLVDRTKPEVDRTSIKEFLQEAPHNLLQIHRSYIVNIDLIKARFSTKVVLKNGTEIPVSRTYKETLDQALGQD